MSTAREARKEYDRATDAVFAFEGEMIKTIKKLKAELEALKRYQVYTHDVLLQEKAKQAHEPIVRRDVTPR